MKVVIDLQVAQAAPQGTRTQYVLQLTRQLIVANEGRGEVLIALSGAFPESIDPIRGAFDDVLPQTQLRVWYPPEGLGGAEHGDSGLRRVAESIREAFITEMQPDLVVEPSLWSGWQDLCVASLSDSPLAPVTALLLPNEADLVPSRTGGEAGATWYQRRLAHCTKARYLLNVPGLTVAANVFSAAREQQGVTFGTVAADPALTVGMPTDGIREAAAMLWDLIQREHAKRAHPFGRALTRKPRLAFVSPLPPEQTGIGYYSAELLPELARYYDIDVVVDQQNVGDEWICAHCGIRSVAWFERHGQEYDRVVYQFGNSRFHAHMWNLIEKIPGVAVIHDFYLGDAVAYREDAAGVSLALPREMYRSHGYAALKPLMVEGNRPEAIRQFPCSYSPIREANGVIVHSRHARDLASHWYGEEIAAGFAVIPHLRQLPQISAQRRRTARQRLGIALDAFLICSFGVVNKQKLPHRLYRAWQQSRLREDPKARIVFVGGSPDEHGKRLRQEIEATPEHDRIHFTGWTTSEDFQDYLAAADVAVQLRTNSRGETSGTVLDCMANGVATICNAHGSFAEVPDQGVWKLEDRFEDEALVEALDTLWADPAKRRWLGEQARTQVQQHYAPAHCGKRYHEAIEAGYSRASRQRLEVVRSAVRHLPTNAMDERLAACIANSLPLHLPQRQLLVDVSAIAREDLRTGVQRVVRSILSQLLKADLPGIRIEPVYTNPGMEGYFYAREFTQRFIGGQGKILPDEPMEAHCGDIFLGLDLHGDGIKAQCEYLEGLRDRGAKVFFVVHDLLPVTHPHWFPTHEEQAFEDWLHCITRFDGAVCVSGTTADDLSKWMNEHNVQRNRPYRIGVAHNGADIRESVPSMGLPEDAEAVLAKLRSKPSFLMVGTVEPRKGVSQVLDAFELLWRQGHDLNLVLVGKRGWNVDDLAKRLEQHAENQRRLFWLRGISDEYLEQVYAESTCLIAGSEGEGFGLPLIEAAQYGIPILARDIPIFREVAGDFAEYFDTNSPKELALAINSWQACFQEKKHPSSHRMPFLTWEESTQHYLNHVMGRAPTYK